MTTTTAVPRKLDDAMIEALCITVAAGNYYHDACAIVGISEFCFYDWIKKAKADDDAGLDETESIYIRLHKSIQKARAQSRAAMVEVIREAATVKREWLPAITFLERTDPKNWGRRDSLQVDETKRVEITVIEYCEQPAPPDPAAIEGEFKEVPAALKAPQDTIEGAGDA